MTSPSRAVLAWMDDRIAWSRLRNRLEKRRVPLHNPAYYVGGTALFLLSLLAASGVLLLMQYRPGAAEAHASVIRIATVLPFGELIRGVHVWSGDLFVAVVLAHVFSVVVRRTFRAPAELLWATGLLLLAASVLLALTGVVLPWGVYALSHSRVTGDSAADIPWIGGAVRRLVLGGDVVSARTLDRAFGFHVALLPATLTLLVGAHMALLRGRPLPISPESEKRGVATIPFYPEFLVRQAALFCSVLLVVLTLATFLPRSPGADAAALSASALAAAEPTRPPWFFAFLHTLVRAAPHDMLGVRGPRFVVGSVLGAFVLLTLLPVIDRRGSKVTLYAAFVVLAALVVLTAYGLT